MMLFQFDGYNVLSTLILSLGINLLFFVFASAFKTDKLTDFSYSLSFIAVTVLLAITRGPLVPAQYAVAGAVLVWALRLGGYLLIRIMKIKKDARFDDKRNNFFRFLLFWLLQAVTVWVVMLPVSVGLSIEAEGAVPVLLYIGMSLWLIGLLIESVSDSQKFVFRNHSANANSWIQSGLWKYSRHPNYFGESLLWSGLSLAVLAISGTGFIWILIGPVFLTLLLLFVSGIPLLEKSADKKYAGNKAYENYKRNTSIFLPWIPGKSRGE